MIVSETGLSEPKEQTAVEGEINNRRIKTLDELTLMDDYMFGVVMSEKANLKPLLEQILGFEIQDLTFVESQRTEKQGYDSRGVRLDLFVKSMDGRIFNVEVQTSEKKSLPKRMRYYQSVLDISVLSPGADYKNLNPATVIFICNYDPYGKSQYLYTFENRCREDPELLFGDGTLKVIANTKGIYGRIGVDLKNTLNYLDSGKVCDEYTRQLDDAVRKIKSSEERRHEYMIMMVRDEEIREEGRAEGREEGRAEGREEGRAEGREEGRAEGRAEGEKVGESRLADLITKLFAAGRGDEVEKAVSDEKFRAGLFTEFNIL